MTATILCTTTRMCKCCCDTPSPRGRCRECVKSRRRSGSSRSSSRGCLSRMKRRGVKSRSESASVGLSPCKTSAPPTPAPSRGQSEESGLMSLPFDLLVNIVCHLCHHELEPVSRVSKKMKEAVFTAKVSHFDYTTPSRVRRFLNPKPVSPIPSEFPDTSMEIFNNFGSSNRPETPNAPKQCRRAVKIFSSPEDIKSLRVKLFSALKLPPMEENLRQHHHHHATTFTSTNRALFVNDC